MKTSIYTLIATISFLCVASGLSAQTCDTYVMFKKGATYEMETFNGKDKLQSKIVYTVKEVTTNAGGISAVLHTTTFDSKNKMQDERDMTMTCSKDKLSIDMANVLKSMQQKCQ